MTYCLSMKVKEGLVCLADGRITSGNQVTTAQKVSLHGPEGAQLCVMTSGLRSLRDKTLAYLDRRWRKACPQGYPSMLDAVSDYTKCLRQVAEEDRAAIEESKLSFNLHGLISGQGREDPEPGIYLVYPEGNWITVGARTPYLSVGATGYGKPILDRALTVETSLAAALKLAYLSFDSTRTSASDVGYPLDLLTYSPTDRQWRQVHYQQDDLRDQRIWWNENITQLVERMPDGPWLDRLAPGAGPARLKVVTDS